MKNAISALYILVIRPIWDTLKSKQWCNHVKLLIKQDRHKEWEARFLEETKNSVPKACREISSFNRGNFHLDYRILTLCIRVLSYIL